MNSKNEGFTFRNAKNRVEHASAHGKAIGLGSTFSIGYVQQLLNKLLLY